MNEHPLRPGTLLSAQAIEALRSHWILSVEQFLGATASPAARSAVAAWIGLDLPAMVRLLAELRAELGQEDEAADLSRPTPGGALGLVVLDPVTETSPTSPDPEPTGPDEPAGDSLP